MKNINEDITSEFHIHKRHLPHWQIGGHTYFITFRSSIGDLPEKALTEVQQTILHGHGERYDLLFGVAMPDHIHLLLRPREKEPGHWHNLAEILKRIKGSSARRINLLLGRSGTVWREEYFDRMIRDENELLEKWSYIWNNPLKKGLANSFEEYPFYIKPQ